MERRVRASGKAVMEALCQAGIIGNSVQRAIIDVDYSGLCVIYEQRIAEDNLPRVILRGGLDVLVDKEQRDALEA